MLEGVATALIEGQRVLEEVRTFENLVLQADKYENFAVIFKSGSYHFVLMNEEQATYVNGLSIPIDNLAYVGPAAKKMILEKLQDRIDAGKAQLKKFATGTPSLPAPPKGGLN